jgi:hypothetical protein
MKNVNVISTKKRQNCDITDILWEINIVQHIIRMKKLWKHIMNVMCLGRVVIIIIAWVLGLVTCSGPINSLTSLLSGHPWLYFPHG